MYRRSVASHPHRRVRRGGRRPRASGWPPLCVARSGIGSRRFQVREPVASIEQSRCCRGSRATLPQPDAPSDRRPSNWKGSGEIVIEVVCERACVPACVRARACLSARACLCQADYTARLGRLPRSGCCLGWHDSQSLSWQWGCRLCFNRTRFGDAFQRRTRSDCYHHFSGMRLNGATMVLQHAEMHRLHTLLAIAWADYACLPFAASMRPRAPANAVIVEDPPWSTRLDVPPRWSQAPRKRERTWTRIIRLCAVPVCVHLLPHSDWTSCAELVSHAWTSVLHSMLYASAPLACEDGRFSWLVPYLDYAGDLHLNVVGSMEPR
jgi:hypothetical protein